MVFFTGHILNTKGEKLNESLLTFTTCLKEKRKLYWKNVVDGVPLQYENLTIIKDEEDDELLCYGYSDDDSDDDSDCDNEFFTS